MSKLRNLIARESSANGSDPNSRDCAIEPLQSLAEQLHYVIFEIQQVEAGTGSNSSETLQVLRNRKLQILDDIASTIASRTTYQP